MKRLGTSPPRGRRGGYTLMEVLIALTILAVSLTILLGTQSSAVQRGAMANQRAHPNHCRVAQDV